MTPRAPSHTVFLVPSASHATKGEAALISAGLACRLIPVPRTLSSQCGVCLRVPLGDRVHAEQVLEEAGVEISGIHDLAMRLPTKETDDGPSITGS